MRTAIAVAGVVALAAGSSSCGAEPSALEAELHDTGLVLYLPELAGELPGGRADAAEPGVTDMDPAPPTTGRPKETARPSSVELEGGVVVITYTRDGSRAYALRELPVPSRSLCRSVPQLAGSDCTEEGGVMRSVMEEQATVGVVRGETLLVLDGLVREAHPDLVDAAVAALLRAPAVSPGDLIAATSDQAGGPG